MPSNKVAKKVPGSAWTEEDLQAAIQEKARNPAISIRGAAKMYGVDESTLRRRLKQTVERVTPEALVTGRRPTFSVEQELGIAKCITIMCRNGFSPLQSDLQDSVQAYVQANNLATPFHDDRPGKDWIRNFMKRNKLSLKKASMLSIARRSNSANFFII